MLFFFLFFSFGCLFCLFFKFFLVLICCFSSPSFLLVSLGLWFKLSFCIGLSNLISACFLFFPSSFVLLSSSLLVLVIS